jgi:hypothetical protein
MKKISLQKNNKDKKMTSPLRYRKTSYIPNVRRHTFFYLFDNKEVSRFAFENKEAKQNFSFLFLEGKYGVFSTMLRKRFIYKGKKFIIQL